MNNQFEFFTTAEVLNLLNCSKSGLANSIKFDGFPAPLKFSFGGKAPSRTTMARYMKAEVLAWLNDKASEARLGRGATYPEHQQTQISPDFDTGAALFHLRNFVLAFKEHRRVLNVVLGPCENQQILPWQGLEKAMLTLIPLCLYAGQSLGIDMDSVVNP